MATGECAIASFSRVHQIEGEGEGEGECKTSNAVEYARRGPLGLTLVTHTLETASGAARTHQIWCEIHRRRFRGPLGLTLSTGQRIAGPPGLTD